jgi:N-acetylneuraminic acid mutarotase
MSDISTVSKKGKSAFDWDVYGNRRTALQYLKANRILIDTIIETEDGRAYALVHSQVLSAFGDKLTEYIAKNGAPIVGGSGHHHQQQQQQSGTTSNLAPITAALPAPPPTTTSEQQKQHQHQLAYHNNAKRLRLVRLPRINRYTLEILVDCAYSGYIRTDLGSGGIWQVLDMADYYEMSDVQRACCAFLIKNLNEFNCVHFYHIGIKHKHPLQRCAWHQIRANFKHILARDLRRSSGGGGGGGASNNRSSSSSMDGGTQRAITEARSLTNRPPDSSTNHNSDVDVTTTVATTNYDDNSHNNDNNNLNHHFSLATIKYEHFEPLLMHDKLNVDNEESVWAAIKLWCQFDLAARQQHVASLLPCIRFPRLRTNIEFSTRHIWRDPLIVNNKQAQHQLAILDRNHRDFLTGLSRYTSATTGGGLFRDGFNLPCAVNPRQLRPRIPHSILLAIGGWQQGQPTTLIESYDSNCNLWFESKHRIVSTLAYHGIECIDGRLYICGGTDGRDILSQLFVFDPTSGQCQFKKSMREDRCYVSTAYLDGRLYAMGGHNGAQRLRSVERYNLDEDSWEHVHDMNAARSDASACVYKHLIYIAGGLNDQVIESSVEFYNKADNSWTYVSSMLVPRTSFALVKYRDTLLAIGGNNGTERLNSVEQYNISSNMWSAHSQMRHRRSTFSAALVDGSKLFVVGGYNGQTPFAQVEMFDEQCNQWIQMQKIRYDRSGLKLVVVQDLPNAAEYTFLGSQGAIGGEYSFPEAASGGSPR